MDNGTRVEESEGYMPGMSCEATWEVMTLLVTRKETVLGS